MCPEVPGESRRKDLVFRPCYSLLKCWLIAAIYRCLLEINESPDGNRASTLPSACLFFESPKCFCSWCSCTFSNRLSFKSRLFYDMIRFSNTVEVKDEWSISNERSTWINEIVQLRCCHFIEMWNIRFAPDGLNVLLLFVKEILIVLQVLVDA